MTLLHFVVTMDQQDSICRLTSIFNFKRGFQYQSSPVFTLNCIHVKTMYILVGMKTFAYFPITWARATSSSNITDYIFQKFSGDWSIRLSISQNVTELQLFWHIGKPQERFQSWVIRVFNSSCLSYRTLQYDTNPMLLSWKKTYSQYIFARLLSAL